MMPSLTPNLVVIMIFSNNIYLVLFQVNYNVVVWNERTAAGGVVRELGGYLPAHPTQSRYHSRKWRGRMGASRRDEFFIPILFFQIIHD